MMNSGLTARLPPDFVRIIDTKYSMKKLYGLAYQWIEDQENRGITPEEANKLAPILLSFFEFVMKQQEKAAKKPSS